MNESNERRNLGMDRRIPRRDFLNGVAVAIGGAYAASRIATLGADGFAKATQAGAPAADYRSRACAETIPRRSTRLPRCSAARIVNSRRWTSTHTKSTTWSSSAVGSPDSRPRTSGAERSARASEPSSAHCANSRKRRRCVLSGTVAPAAGSHRRSADSRQPCYSRARCQRRSLGS